MILQMEWYYKLILTITDCDVHITYLQMEQIHLLSGFKPGSTLSDPGRGATSLGPFGQSIISLDGLVHPLKIDQVYLTCPHSHQWDYQSTGWVLCPVTLMWHLLTNCYQLVHCTTQQPEVRIQRGFRWQLQLMCCANLLSCVQVFL